MSHQPRLQGHDLLKFARAAADDGWSWEVSGSGHLRWRHREVTGPIFTARTPRANGCHKERQKLATALRRARAASAI